MTYKNNHPTLIATSRCDSKVLKSIDSVAAYIMNAGLCGDIHMIDTDGNLFLTTNGIFIDYTVDDSYRQELLETLDPMQQVVCEFTFRCSKPLTKAEVLEIFATDNAPDKEEEDSDEEDDEDSSEKNSDETERFHNFLD